MNYFINREFLKNFLLIFLLFLIALSPLFSKETESINYNSYYQFLFSMGVSYQSISPFSNYGSDFNIYEILGTFRLPLNGMPSIQSLLQIGLGQYDSRNYLDEGDKWDHSQVFTGIGLSYVNRFSKDFEVGLDLVGGGALSVFQNLNESATYSLPYAYAEAGGILALDPSYSLSIKVRPKLKYQFAFEPSDVDMSDFNGFSLGMGISISYRFGEDPDSAASLIRSIKFVKTDLSSVFAALQSYYINNPIATATLTNKESKVLKNMEIYFFQAGLMDAPTPCLSIESIDPGETIEVPVYAFFNNSVFNTEGVTPFTGEIIVQYEYRNRAAEQRFSVSYDLHDKTALTWDNAEKVAAFITPADSALRNYASFIRQSVKDDTVSDFNKPLQAAVQIFNGLDVLGCLYQSDPSSPFTVVQGDVQVVDSVSLPRDTLKRITGDCDDLTVLYCSLLETLGIETAYITIPGHIYAAFNTKVSSSKYMILNPERNMTINLNGELWIPVEITMIGLTGFMESWRKGASEWNALNDNVESRAFYQTRKAQETFRPVGLTETDLGLQYGNSSSIVNGFRKDFKEIQQSLLNSYEDRAKRRGKKQDYNQLGVRYSMFGRYDDADKAFSRAVSMDKNYLPAQVNQANLDYLLGNNERALQAYQSVVANLNEHGKGSSPIAGKLLLNIARSYYDSQKYEDARDIFARAEAIVPQESQKYAYLSASDDSGARASGVGLETGMMFIEDTDYEE